MTRRLTATLKKRLQANLEHLTAKEAGRLYVIYSLGAAKQGVRDMDYPPIRELLAALETRVDRTVGQPEQKEAIDTLRGFTFLAALYKAVNYDAGFFLIVSFATDAYQVMAILAMLFKEDATTKMIRAIRANFLDDTPMPVSHDDYRRLKTWATDQAVYSLDQVAYDAAFLKVDNGELPEEREDEERNRLYTDLVAKLEAGELIGGEGVAHPELHRPVLIEDGELPAWAALRILWKPYLAGRGYKIIARGTVTNWSPSPIDQVFAPTGELLDQEALKKVAGDFYKTCRRRPWGKGLSVKPSLDDLVKLLTQSPNPFLHIYPADFGQVAWKTFSENERNWNPDRRLADNEERFATEPVATFASLQEIGELDLHDEDLYDEDAYYPTQWPTSVRASIARIFDMMSDLDTSRQPFTYGYTQKGKGEISLSEFLGVNFLTPLERQVANLQAALVYGASLRAAFQLIADRYFGGMSILGTYQEDRLRGGDDHLKLATEGLKAWTRQLADWPWEVETSSLQLDDPKPDSEEIDAIVAKLLDTAKNAVKNYNPDVLLGME